MIDAHCHLDDPRLETVITEVLQRGREAGVKAFVTAGVSSARWRLQREIAMAHKDVFVAYGLHPWEVASLDSTHLQNELKALATCLEEALTASGNLRPVALGECGLDRSSRVDEGSFGLQVEALREQLALARELELPVVLHVVKAHGKMLSLLKEDGAPSRGGLVHAFSGSLEVAQAYVKEGLMISFGGMVTRPNAKKAREAAASLGCEWLLTETDAPDMLPHSIKAAYNEPALMRNVLVSLASLRGTDVASISLQTSENAQRLFGISV